MTYRDDSGIEITLKQQIDLILIKARALTEIGDYVLLFPPGDEGRRSFLIALTKAINKSELSDKSKYIVFKCDYIYIYKGIEKEILNRVRAKLAECGFEPMTEVYHKNCYARKGEDWHLQIRFSATDFSCCQEKTAKGTFTRLYGEALQLINHLHKITPPSNEFSGGKLFNER
jgi:hypothetical protein